ncbi:hypothetical protein BT63DRAFT_289658 [Microthyrium microscopicum]|uniref:Uncharacterized protein n=1 Tax=Microthyrium microscopicum TaxID=703497 RepID=A0A6A6U6T4_9PEZI|nr:hypothetical protein BT63DRAFT_289658 [Microthyrium microscopicum]
MHASRFQSFAPSNLRTSGLRRLKTAFSPSSSVSSTRSFRFNSGASTPHRSPSSSSSTGTASPLSSHMGSPALNGDCETMEGLVILPTTSYALDGLVLGDTIKPAVQTRSESSRNRLRTLLMRRRRQQSSWDLRVDEEQRAFGAGVNVFEPRQKGTISMGSIFEVLDGKY